MTANGPIFIGGPDRCGKTLVAALLASHSRIAISAVGSNMWTLFYGRFGDLADDANASACISALLRYKHVQFMRPDPDRLRADFRTGERTYGRLFALIQEQHAERAGKARWGDQTGLVERFADEIYAAYRDVRFIHMIRDPRDRYEASLKLWPDGRLRAGGAAARWTVSADLAARNARHHAGAYHVLRYEDLVVDPAGVTARLCDFIGEKFEPAMLDLVAMPDYRAKLEASVAGLPADERSATLISPRFVGAYRGRVEPAELAFIQDVSRRRMAEHGYRVEPVPMATRERLRYLLVDFPRNAARMIAWRLREQAAYRVPKLMGRRPRPGMIR